MEKIKSVEIDVDDDVLVMGSIESENHENMLLKKDPEE